MSNKICGNCGGSGQIQCPACGGSGARGSQKDRFNRISNCARCNGRGITTCGSCRGTGTN